MILEGLDYSQKLAKFVIDKAKFYRNTEGKLNERQNATVDRLLRDGPESFVLELNAEKYIRITETSRATATRDLQDLVEKGIFVRSGERKATRYQLKSFTNAG